MKNCFKCGVEKPLSEFYKHPQMADGHVNKCKVCNKKDIKENYQSNLLKPGYIEKERKRGRDKYHRLYEGTAKADIERNIRWSEKYPEKEAVRKKMAFKKVQIVKTSGLEAHHWSYNICHWDSFIELTKQHHMKAHRFIVYDQERFMYRRFDTNELLDTKEKHEAFIRHCIDNFEN